MSSKVTHEATAHMRIVVYGKLITRMRKCSGAVGVASNILELVPLHCGNSVHPWLVILTGEWRLCLARMNLFLHIWRRQDVARREASLGSVDMCV